MTYHVQLQPLAESDLEQAYHWAAKQAPHTARAWVLSFRERLRSLESNPERCELAPENKRLKRQLRQFLFGTRPNVFRVLFVVEANEVLIVRIRHASRRSLRKADLGE